MHSTTWEMALVVFADLLHAHKDRKSQFSAPAAGISASEET